MKIITINGSERDGNTKRALDAFCLAARKNNIVEEYKATDFKLEFCKGCGVCMCYKGCVLPDDTNIMLDKLISADMIVFSTPVYWWGISAQLKLLIDKCYAKGAFLKNKKIGLIVCGGSPLDSMQYSLIKKQFDLMASYLNWNIEFYLPFYATKRDDLDKDDNAINNIINIANNIK